MMGMFDKARDEFPRLYFVSDEELVELLSISRNPTALVPFVRKCFSGIDNLIFDLPSKVDGMGSSLDFTLNGMSSSAPISSEQINKKYAFNLVVVVILNSLLTSTITKSDLPYLFKALPSFKISSY